MPSSPDLALFVTASLVLLLVPGPAVLYVVARSVDEGHRTGIVSTLGLALGNLVHVTAASVGVAALVLSSITAFTVLKYGGAAYLIYLGIRTWRGRRQADRRTKQFEPRLRRAFWDGVLVNLLNPKSALFLLAFLPQFADPVHGSVGAQVFILGVIFVGLGIATDSLYVLFAGSVGSLLRSRRSLGVLQRLVTGGVYIGLGLATAVSGGKNR